MSHVRRDDERPGDLAVKQAWRAAAADEPSAQLDATILAAARAAVARAKSAPPPPATRHWWAHWQPLAAAAGVAGLAFTIVQMLPRESDVPATPSAEQAIERARPDRSESVTQRNAPPPPPSPASREADTEHPATAKHASPAASPPPSLPSTGAEARDVAGATAEAGALSEQRLRQNASPPAAPTTPEDWARRIEALYGAGEQSAAADALQAFREAHPDADQYLEESLQPWATSVDKGRARAKEPAGITP